MKLKDPDTTNYKLYKNGIDLKIHQQPVLDLIAIIL